MMYGQLCTEFYDADKKFAPIDEVDFYLKIFNQNHLILEPMCGSGRLLIPLLQASLNVHGVDSSKDMLKSCKERANAVSLNPTLIESTIKDMSLSQKYDGIIIPLDLFNYFIPEKLHIKCFKFLKNI